MSQTLIITLTDDQLKLLQTWALVACPELLPVIEGGKHKYEEDVRDRERMKRDYSRIWDKIHKENEKAKRSPFKYVGYETIPTQKLNIT